MITYDDGSKVWPRAREKERKRERERTLYLVYVHGTCGGVGAVLGASDLVIW